MLKSGWAYTSVELVVFVVLPFLWYIMWTQFEFLFQYCYCALGVKDSQLQSWCPIFENKQVWTPQGFNNTLYFYHILDRHSSMFLKAKPYSISRFCNINKITGPDTDQHNTSYCLKAKLLMDFFFTLLYKHILCSSWE